MAIKGGDLIHVGNLVLIHRAQTAGPGQVNIPTEKIYELGNYYSVAQIRDIPDLSFSLDSLDVSAEFESLLCGKTFTGMTDGTELKLAKSVPMDVAGQFKAGFRSDNAYDVVGSVAMPYLVLESVSYKFGISDKATQSASLKGDSVFYNPGSTFIQEAVGGNIANQTILLAEPAIPYNGDATGGTRYALSVSLASGKRLTHGTEFTETTAAGTGNTKVVTVHITNAVPATDKIRVTYASTTIAQYPQNRHVAASATRPAAIKGRNIEVYVGGVALTDKWSSVQNANVDWKVTLERDEEFGNSQVVDQDFDVPDVTGSVVIKPRSFADLYDKVRQVADVAVDEVAGALTTQPLPLTIVLRSPEAGDDPDNLDPILKTLHVPDARFTFPGYSGQVQSKLTVTFDFSSDTGDLSVFKGPMP